MTLFGCAVTATLLVAVTAACSTTPEATETSPTPTTHTSTTERSTRPPGSLDYRDYLTNGTLPLGGALENMVPPIYGYGDFSAYAYNEVNRDQAMAAHIRCLHDQGWPVEPIGTRGMSFAPIPDHLNLAAQFDSARCYAGLRLPAYASPTRSSIEQIYSYWTQFIAPCLRNLGHSIPDPPSIDTFAETYPLTDWAPWRFVEWTPELAEQCPPDTPYNWTP
jgi:hypothetical protein